MDDFQARDDVTTAVVHYTTSMTFLNTSSAAVMTTATADATIRQASVAQPHDANIALGLVLSTFACLTVLGNILVILAVVRERYLRSATNYFIVSLALADLVIGSVVMPFAISLEVTNQRWLFGRDWCDVWHSFDVLASTASILNLSVIALDRYLAITNPMKYPTRITHSRILVLIALVWILSSLISFPAILWWRASSESRQQLPQACTFTEDPVYLVLSSIVSFYVPVIVILYAYYRIYRAASAQMRSFRTGRKVMTRKGHKGQPLTLRVHRGGRIQRIAQEAVTCAQRTHSNCSDISAEPETLLSPGRSDDATTNNGETISPSRMVNRKWQKFAISRKISKIAKEQKAAKTLGIVMGVFCVCWVPFFVTNVLYGLCNTTCVKRADILLPVFTWLGYINSSMNPVIYACSMRDFRRAFYKILCCCLPAYKLKRFGVGRSRAHAHTTATTSTSNGVTSVVAGDTAAHAHTRQSQRSTVKLLVNGESVDVDRSSSACDVRNCASSYDTVSLTDS